MLASDTIEFTFGGLTSLHDALKQTEKEFKKFFTHFLQSVQDAICKSGTFCDLVVLNLSQTSCAWPQQQQQQQQKATTIIQRRHLLVKKIIKNRSSSIRFESILTNNPRLSTQILPKTC